MAQFDRKGNALVPEQRRNSKLEPQQGIEEVKPQGIIAEPNTDPKN